MMPPKPLRQPKGRPHLVVMGLSSTKAKSQPTRLGVPASSAYMRHSTYRHTVSVLRNDMLILVTGIYTESKTTKLTQK
jgi:hypothetical protein